MLRQLFVLILAGVQTSLLARSSEQIGYRPNILFVISDDQSFPFASVYGTDWVKTPNFDQVARNGIFFTNAFVTSPGCSPSRASMLTGRYPWQIEEAGTHGSSFPTKYKTFTQVLEENGYAVGYTGKPWGPGDWQVSGWKQNPVGKEFNQKKLKPPYSGISNIDYAGNFEVFLQQRASDQSFFFWFGAHEPHRAFEEGSGLKENKSETNVKVPGFLPGHSVVKKDLLDYAVEIEWYDQQLGKILGILKSIGEKESTLIIVTSDNGMPFPRAKANCYDSGIHVPLAICWGKEISSGQVSGDLISTVDLAPTILEAAGLKFDGEFPMSGKSILKELCSPKYKIQQSGQEIFAGRERHSSARYENRGYPQRSIRTEQYLYIKNYHPEYWPSGDPQVYLDDGSLSEMHGAYMDIDDSPTLQLFKKQNIADPVIASYFIAAAAKRPVEELYDIKKDPDCMTNLAAKHEFTDIKKQLSNRLVDHLKATGDTREVGSNPEIWESYPRLKGEIRKFPLETKN
jgi:N-sulfoglucosamine sulfohydrolase